MWPISCARRTDHVGRGAPAQGDLLAHGVLEGQGVAHDVGGVESSSYVVVPLVLVEWTYKEYRIL